jgi:putative ABC transport system permease protein
MVSVTGISLGLASESIINSEGVQYWIVPEEADVQSVAVSTGGVQLGEVHSTSQRIEHDSRVRYATPVLVELVPVEDANTGSRDYLLAVGVLGRSQADILGLPTGALTPGDPHYASGGYNGPWTGDAILNDAAVTITNASASTSLEIAKPGNNRSFTVVNITAGEGPSAIGSAPVALVHLSELQTLTGGAAGDQADQILVNTDDSGVKDDLERLYPRATILTRSGLSGSRLANSSMPLAVAVAAFLTAVVVGVLFVMMLMGLEISADRQQLGTMVAIGFSDGALSLIVGVETIIIALSGGLAGLGLGAIGIVAINQFGRTILGVGSVAVFDPLFVIYAALVTLVIAILGAIYPIILSRRMEPLEVLRE